MYLVYTALNIDLDKAESDFQFISLAVAASF